MSKWLGVLAVGIFAFVFWRSTRESLPKAQSRPPERTQVKIKTTESRTVEVEAKIEERAAPPATQAKPVEVNPYHVDRFSLRQLDKPKPKSVHELMSRLTPYSRPLLPSVVPGQEETGDGDVLTGYRGYYELPSGELRRIIC